MAEYDNFGFRSLGSTSSSLVRGVKVHDQEAWTKLVRLYGPLVSLWLRQARLQPADANDVFQVVFVAVAMGVEQFHKDRPGDSFRGWLRVIVRSKLVDHFRKQRGQPIAVGGSEAHRQFQQLADPGEEPPEAPGEAKAVRQLRLRALGMIRAEFEDRTWQAFWRVTVDGQPPKEVAQELGVTPSAVRLAKSRVLRRLREELSDLEP
jgi:RNA polymerase sigma-70 factor (ECF subfamily)